MLPLLNLVQRHASGANISVGGQGGRRRGWEEVAWKEKSGRCQMTSLIIAMNTTHMHTPHQYLPNCRYALFCIRLFILYL